MQEVIEDIGESALAGGQRRQVNAESFRRLTALLKNLQPFAPIVNQMPDLVPEFAAPPTALAEAAVEVSGADESNASAGYEEASPPDIAFDLPPNDEMEAVSAIEEAASVAPGLTASDSGRASEVDITEPQVSNMHFFDADHLHDDVISLEYHPQAEVDLAFAETPLLQAEDPLPESPILIDEPVQEETVEPEFEQLVQAEAAEPEIEEAIPVATLEPQIEETVQAEAVEPEIEEAIPVATLEPQIEETVQAEAVEPEIEAAIPVATLEPQFEAAPETKRESAGQSEQAYRARLRQRAADAFSLIPDSAGQPRTEQVLTLTPQQEAESAELARSLMDMMAASASGGQPQERALAADTLLRLLPRLPARTRTTLAERLTMMEAPPPFLVAKLIVEPDLTISGPLLEDCMHISDEDLLQLIASGNGDKRRLIARRRRISRPVSEALAATEDTSVLLTLVRNQGAEISQDGFSLLAGSAKENAEILPPLCTRHDLPVHFAFELFWFAPAQLRRYLLSRFLTDSENLTKILKITMDSHDEAQTPSPSMELAAVLQTLSRFMDDDATLADRDEQVAILAAAAQVRPATVERILQDDQGEPLMALLKVLGVPRSMLEVEMPVLAKGAQHLIDPSRNLAEVQAVFDQLSFTKARILLTYWDWSTAKSGPYAAAN